MGIVIKYYNFLSILLINPVVTFLKIEDVILEIYHWWLIVCNCIFIFSSPADIHEI